MIEEQRAAKKKDFMASPLPRAATTSDLSKQSAPVEDLSRSKSAKSPPGPFSTLPRVRALGPSDVQHVKMDSFSSASSSGTGLSGRTGSTRKLAGALTADITPSSSYERFEEDVKTTSTKSATDYASSKPTRQRGRVDLSGIEEMMKDLTESPEWLNRTLTDLPSKGDSSAPRPRAATDASKSDREQVLELELQRLREKERSRHLQALKLKDKKKKERAAKRCCVCDCSLSSSRTPFVERDGKLLCARDWKELYLPKCRKCNLIVEKGAVKSSDGALRGVFHRSCFSCAACEAPFTDGTFYVFNNQPYCSRHYHRLNGSVCRECDGGIEGDCRQTDTGDRFHPHCFSCQYSSSKSGECLEQLADYYMVGGQRLCERHADKIGRRLAQAGQEQLDLRAQKRVTMLHSLR
uniref:LIM zinc-binding domain-containing protein n=2 Tax=Kalmanozyma brasiliensis (strain GHG001) TaxID=1365824 RepID=V5EB62_KALBG